MKNPPMKVGSNVQTNSKRLNPPFIELVILFTPKKYRPYWDCTHS